MPTYHLASCVDDADLRISHIIRGQDHLTNTFKHLLIFEALGVEPPAVRASAAAGRARRRQALQAQARPGGQRHDLSRCRFPARRPSSIFSACWAGRPKNDREFLTLDELTAAFTLEGVNRSNAVVNFTEEDPFRSQGRLAQRRTHPRAARRRAQPRASLPFFDQAGLNASPEKLLAVTPLIRERIKLLRDASRCSRLFLRDELAPYDPAELIPPKRRRRAMAAPRSSNRA